MRSYLLTNVVSDGLEARLGLDAASHDLNHGVDFMTATVLEMPRSIAILSSELSCKSCFDSFGMRSTEI